MKTVVFWFLAALCFASSGGAMAADSALQRLHDAIYANDFEEFSRVLDEGTIDPSIFALDAMAYDVLCVSTYVSRLDFLKRLLAYDVDPSTRDPEGSVFTAVPLSCAAREYNPTAFKMLLDAGADSNVSDCLGCLGSHHTLVASLHRDPELIQMIIQRRELTAVELESLALKVERFYVHKQFKGKLVGEYYADYLRERGYDVVPKGPYEK